MIGPVRTVAGHSAREVDGWQVCATSPGSEPSPGAAWWPGASTAAATLRAAGALPDVVGARRLDAEDWWWRTRFEAQAEPGEELALRFEGLATVAEVRLDGALLLESDNMFRAFEVPIERGGELTIRFRALDTLLGARRPRPRWRVPMVEHQQLRWLRTTLLGRTPGWSPPWPAVGPWRPVRVVSRRGLAVDAAALRAEVDGSRGRLTLQGRVRWLGARLGPATLEVEREGVVHRGEVSVDGDGALSGSVLVEEVARWWPHTHGQPALYAVTLRLGAVTVELGRVGFREVRREGDFRLLLNGAPVFCRGACWTPLDPVTLSSSRGELRATLAKVRGAGMNMLRVGGTMVYEGDDFFDLCDELGVLVWQDFMFANFDYPADPAFVANCVEEARQVLGRIAHRPSLALLCGNSEVEQQAAMWGASRDYWAPPLFHATLPALAAELAPGVPYWPSSAHGGAFPHQVSSGTTSYYGVGAYLRPLDDARRSDVRFASECLAFANVPDHTAHKVHSPAWKARSPRDGGAGWDFDDVRDHYVARLFGVDPAALRYQDHDRYLALGRVATGEVMAQTFGEWRRQGSSSGGGLVWFLRDLWAGAGWGVLDAGGLPKAAYWYLRRALRRTAVHISDEGNSGLAIWLLRDGLPGEAIDGELELAYYRDFEILVGSAKRAVRAPATLNAVDLLDGFSDLSFAFRFGPPACDLVVATLRTDEGSAEAFHFPLGLPSRREPDLGLIAERRGDLVTVRTRRFAQSVFIDGDADDNYFHLAPGATRTFGLRRGDHLQPLNCLQTTRIVPD